jgi:CDP-diacylglycerol--glycerol-3-phosphate 3-phosphatidyltransferase
MKLIPQWLQRPFERAVIPLADRLIAQGVHPNTLTTIGLLIVVGSATAFAFGHARTGGVVLLLSGLFDVLDGKVARGGGKKSPYGAFYDSTLDRIGEALLFGGITVFFVNGGVPEAWEVWATLASLTALGGGLTVSYTRARAEGLNLECKVGLIQRAERIVGLGAPLMFFGAGRNGWLVFLIVAIIGLLSVFTVLQRIMHVYNVTREPKETITEPVAAEPIPALVNEDK